MSDASEDYRKRGFVDDHLQGVFFSQRTVDDLVFVKELWLTNLAKEVKLQVFFYKSQMIRTTIFGVVKNHQLAWFVLRCLVILFFTQQAIVSPGSWMIMGTYSMFSTHPFKSSQYCYMYFWLCTFIQFSLNFPCCLLKTLVDIWLYNESCRGNVLLCCSPGNIQTQTWKKSPNVQRLGAWSPAKKQWCCTAQGKGCEGNQPPHVDPGFGMVWKHVQVWCGHV